ncbi:hypothetical protein [Shivajiella indica]
MGKVLNTIFLLISLTSFGQKMQEENVFVHVSKNITLVNETVWFQIYLIQDELVPLSKFAYCELVDRNNQAVHQIIIPLQEGKAEGHMDIPNHLESDHYILRFYTRISPLINKNGQGVFSKFITIINPKKPPIQNSLTQKVSKYAFKKPGDYPMLSSEKGLTTNSEIEIPLIKEKATVSVSIINPFLPESFYGFAGQEIYQKLSENSLVIPELYGHIVHAKNLNPEIDTTETFFLSAHGKQSVLNSSKPNLQGDMYFELGPLKEYKFLIAQSLESEKQLNFSPQSPFLPLEFKEDFVFPELILNENDREFIEDLIISAQVNTYFYGQEDLVSIPIITGFVADRTYLLDDYTRFEDMETTLREYVPEVMVRKQSKKTLYKVLNSPLNAIFQENPLILIDAMPVFDTDALARFDPKGIMKLEVLTREFSFNQDKFAGVISFTSFENDFGKFELPTNALYLDYWTIISPKKLISANINPNIGKTNYPDFRTNLFWDTSVTGDKMKIISSEIKGKYELLISYTTEGGETSFNRAVFKVEN